MLDTNVLLAATDRRRKEHQDALTIVQEWPENGTALYLSGQIVREYLAVATRPMAQNGLGMDQASALSNARGFQDRMTVLADDDAVLDRLYFLLTNVTCGGKQVHDANVVATMLAHGIGSIITANLDDFARFTRYVSLLAL